MLRTVCKCIAAALCAVALSLTAFPAIAQQKIKLTYATIFGPGEFFEVAAKHFMDEVQKKTNGQVTFETYYSGSLLKALELGPGVTRGIADIALGFPAAYHAKDYPLTGIVMPFVSENPRAVTAAFLEVYSSTPALQQEFTRNGVRPLFVVAAAENTLWTLKPVRTPEDLKGLRIRTIPGIAEAFQALGATPVSMPFVDSIELFSRGGVDGVSGIPFNQAIGAGLLDIAKYASNGGRFGVYALTVWSMNLNAWNKLPENVKSAMTEAAKTIPDYYFGLLDKDMDESAKKFRASKVQAIAISDADLPKWRVAAAKTEQKWIDGSGLNAADAAALLRKYKDAVKAAEAGKPYVTGMDRVTKSP